jgi:hypothetical protein
VLRLPDPEPPDVVYLEHLLSFQAEPAAATPAILGRILDDLERSGGGEGA